MANTDVYFANLPGDELTVELAHRVDAYYNWLLTSGRLSRWRLAYNTFYGQRGDQKSFQVTSAGKQGELSFLMSNEFANLVRHLYTMTKQAKTSLEMVAVNTDSESKAAAYVGKGIVEYYRRHGNVDKHADSALLTSLLMDTAWTFNEWDFSKGDDLAADESAQGGSLRNGDIYSRAKTPLEVIIDFTRTDFDRDWVIVKDQVNKWDAAAQTAIKDKEKAEEVSRLQLDRNQDALFRFGEIFEWEGFESSMVDRYTFYHRKTQACPNGRMHVFYNPRLWTYTAPIPYRKLPGNRICPGEMILSCLGFSPTNDLLALQDVMDSLISAAVTNMTSLGVNNLWVKNAANFDFEKLAEGMNLFEADEKPEVLILNRLPPEWFNLANFIVQRMEAISGVNSVARGNTEGKDFSGAAMALLQSMSISFNSGLQESRNQLIEDNGNDILYLTQDFASEEKMGLIIGRNNRYMMKKYKGSDLKKIYRVFARQSNPLKDTTAGKLTMAQDLIKMGSLKDAGAYAEILDTGNLDSLTEPNRNSRLTVDEENDALVMGKEIPVMLTDNHVEHINGHKKMIDSPDDRVDAALVQRVTNHLMEHLQVWSSTPVDLLAALGIPPMMAPMAQPGQPQAPGEPPPPGGQTPEGGAPPPMPGGNHPPGPMPEGVAPNKTKGPNMPRNPLSKQPWNPEDGGLGQ